MADVVVEILFWRFRIQFLQKFIGYKLFHHHATFACELYHTFIHPLLKSFVATIIVIVFSYVFYVSRQLF